ncbi:hypothetical protein, partial [Mycolicibacterium obuense]|uniref:hypothetical protein n=1 Tax=Mycolicibacterium obuense TaxID=1807 RepID=UPI001F28D3A4
NRTRIRRLTSATSMTNNYPVVVMLRDGQQPVGCETSPVGCCIPSGAVTRGAHVSLETHDVLATRIKEAG